MPSLEIFKVISRPRFKTRGWRRVASGQLRTTVRAYPSMKLPEPL
jgi:hypothetical protein